MPFTWEDFDRWYNKENFLHLTPEERREVLQALPPEEWQEFFEVLSPQERLEGLSPEQIREYLDQLTTKRSAAVRKRFRKK